MSYVKLLSIFMRAEKNKDGRMKQIIILCCSFYKQQQTLTCFKPCWLAKRNRLSMAFQHNSSSFVRKQQEAAKLENDPPIQQYQTSFQL